MPRLRSRHRPPIRKRPADRVNDPDRPDLESTNGNGADHTQSHASPQGSARRAVGSRWGYANEPNLIAMAWALVEGPLRDAEIERPDWLVCKPNDVLDELNKKKPINPVDAELVRDLYWRAVASLQFGRYMPWGVSPFGMLYRRSQVGDGRWPWNWTAETLLPHVAAAWPCEGEA